MAVAIGRERRSAAHLAGAGTGKTNTLAHRTAHLVLNGTDPSRIMLTSRAAPLEMIKRTQGIVAEVMADRARRAIAAWYRG
jgi:DNA helicase-2/ATP-dependent DNA helicase PcrA